jgi:uncharacterized protein YacL
MAPCTITCFIAAVIIVAMVVMMVMVKYDPFIQTYGNSLPSELKTAYKQIANERMKIYSTGYLIGLVAAALLIVFNVSVLRKKMPVSAMVCLTVVLSTVINYFYYMLTPKSAHMVDLLKTDQQKSDWLKMYKSMQYYYHMSFVLGAVAVGVFTFAFRGSC